LTPGSTACSPSPPAAEVSHGAVIALELTGAVLILAGFTLGQLRLLDQHSLPYLVLNLVGSFVLAVIAWVDERWGFLLLEGVWSVVSAVGLVALLGRFGSNPSPRTNRAVPRASRRRHTLKRTWRTSPSRTT
jgi:hypothetical protein